MRDVVLGRLSVSQVYEGDAVIPLAQALPSVTAQDLAELKRWYWDAHLAERPADASMRISVHSFILRVDGRNILIDTCCGNDKKRSLPPVSMQHWPYLENLARTGLRPEDIDVVLCTHLHFDHVGWNTRLADGAWVPTFPNARYLFGRRELEFFSRQRHEVLHREAFDDSVAPILDAGLADLVDADSRVHREIGDGIWLQDASGHSPGNLCVIAECGGARAIFSGDCFHHPIQLVRPDAAFFADEDPARASATRRGLIDQYADSDAIFFPAHFTGATAGRVAHDSAGRLSFRFLQA
ncbi:MAG TPA: MBL fold metallo-hydrolase [Steroidobacteraceae bacterium]|jgi:glyoxylase-like metal-dependent hydrolase (beta-lactamase superfamily II)|nr:MBL fold metallo-hydrolase [Steroidobacteraceae bacterium]